MENRASGGAVATQQLDQVEPMKCARVLRLHLLPSGAVISQLAIQGAAKLGKLVPRVDCLDSLFRPKCNQNAKHDDPDFAGELAPPM